MTSDWRRYYHLRAHRDDQGWYMDRGHAVKTSIPLSEGYMLTVRFILNPRGDSVNTVVTAKRRFGRVRWGTPTGPGGTEVWVALQNLWTPGERAVRDNLVPLSRLSGVELQVAAETSRLMRIYRRYLEPRGYRFFRGPDEDLLVKYLTKGLT